MKLHEVVEVDDDTLYLKKGYFLKKFGDWRPYVPKKHMETINYFLYHISDHDASLGTVTVVRDPISKEGWTQSSVPDLVNRGPHQFRVPSKHFVHQVVGAIMNDEMQYVLPTNESLASDLFKARKKNRDDRKPVWLVRLNKDGSESKMHDARRMFHDEDEAIAAHKAMVGFNPGKTIEHHLYSRGLNDVQMKVKLSNGEILK